jgi:hypothetical protein
MHTYDGTLHCYVLISLYLQSFRGELQLNICIELKLVHSHDHKWAPFFLTSLSKRDYAADIAESRIFQKNI